MRSSSLYHACAAVHFWRELFDRHSLLVLFGYNFHFEIGNGNVRDFKLLPIYTRVLSAVMNFCGNANSCGWLPSAYPLLLRSSRFLLLNSFFFQECATVSRRWPLQLPWSRIRVGVWYSVGTATAWSKTHRGALYREFRLECMVTPGGRWRRDSTTVLLIPDSTCTVYTTSRVESSIHPLPVRFLHYTFFLIYALFYMVR